MEVDSCKTVIGYRFEDKSIPSIVDDIIIDAIKGNKRQVFFVNAHCVNVAEKDPLYKDILNEEPFLYADGAGMAIAARVERKTLLHNVNGTDLFPVLCDTAATTGVPIAFLGAQPGISKKCRMRMESIYPGLNVVWTGHGYYSKNEEEKIVDDINRSEARILLVAKGVPLQEKWIYNNREKITVPIQMGIGALFDFYSGSIERAPNFMRTARLEWVYRLMLEPKRMFKRYILGNPVFIGRLLKNRLIGIR